MDNFFNLVSSIFTPVVNKCSVTSLSFHKFSFFILVISCSFSAQASSFTFNLRGSEAALALDGFNSGQLTSNGLIANFVAGPGVSTDRIFNQTATRFGINSLGTSDDSSSLIDSANGIPEFLSISFNEAIILDQLILSVFAPGEVASLSIASASSLLLVGLTVAEDIYNFSNLALGVEEKIMLSHVAGNGFSFDSITVSTVEVPEPAIFTLILAGVIGLLIFRRRKDCGIITSA